MSDSGGVWVDRVSFLTGILVIDRVDCFFLSHSFFLFLILLIQVKNNRPSQVELSYHLRTKTVSAREISHLPLELLKIN